jgi:hypothetical protein
LKKYTKATIELCLECRAGRLVFDVISLTTEVQSKRKKRTAEGRMANGVGYNATALPLIFIPFPIYIFFLRTFRFHFLFMVIQ